MDHDSTQCSTSPNVYHSLNNERFSNALLDTFCRIAQEISAKRFGHLRDEDDNLKTGGGHGAFEDEDSLALGSRIGAPAAPIADATDARRLCSPTDHAQN